jgi:hypothetical protein
LGRRRYGNPITSKAAAIEDQFGTARAVNDPVGGR